MSSGISIFAGMDTGDLRDMSRSDLEREFALRRRALLEVRDELDRRDRESVGGGRSVNVEFCDYVDEG